MKLSTVKKRLEAQQSLCYQSPAEFVSDIRLVFGSCAVLSEVLYKEISCSNVQFLAPGDKTFCPPLCFYLHGRPTQRSPWRAGSLRISLKVTWGSSSLTTPFQKSNWRRYPLPPLTLSSHLTTISFPSLQSAGALVRPPRTRRAVPAERREERQSTNLLNRSDIRTLPAPANMWCVTLYYKHLWYTITFRSPKMFYMFNYQIILQEKQWWYRALN